MNFAHADSTVVNSSDASYIRAGSGKDNTNYSGETILLGQTAGSDASGDFLRGLFTFDLSDAGLVAALNGGGSITSVSLTLTDSGADSSSTNGAVTLDLFQLTQDYTSGEVTWNDYAAGSAWSSAGGDYGATLLSSASADPGTIVLGNTVTLASSSNFISAVGGNVGASGSISLLLKLNAEGANASRELFKFTKSGDPALTIEYSAIPEPSTYALLAGIMGLLSIMLLRRSHR